MKTELYKDWKSGNTGEFKNYRGYEDNDRNRVVLFDSASDVIESIHKNVKNRSWDRTKHYNSNKNIQWTYGSDFPTMEATNEALEFGKMADIYLSKVELKKQQLFSEIPRLRELFEIGVAKRRKRQFTEDGSELDIDRYMCGDPAMFSDMPRMDVKARIARIFFNVAVSSGVSTQTLTDNIISCCAICDIIQSSGVSCEIWAAYCTRESSTQVNWMTIGVQAKAANEPMDINRMLTFALPGMFRSHIFVLIQNLLNSSETSDEGLGIPIQNNNDLLIASNFFEADVKMSGQNFYQKDLNLIIEDIEKFFKITEY